MYPFYETRKNAEAFYFTTFLATNIIFPPHLHSYVELIYVVEGELLVTINDKKKEIKKGEIAFSFPNDIHSYETSNASIAIIIIFSPEIINGYFGNKSDLTLENPFYYCPLKIIEFLNIILEEFNTTKNEFIIKGMLYSIFGKMDSVFTFENKKYTYDSTVQLLLKYIESHFTENLSLDSLSKALGFSKFYISRLFTKKIGYQFNEYINMLRINMAQSLLTDTSMSILNIAFECGFDSQRNFNRVFKHFIVLTPREFREKQTTLTH